MHNMQLGAITSVKGILRFTGRVEAVFKTVCF